MQTQNRDRDSVGENAVVNKRSVLIWNESVGPFYNYSILRAIKSLFPFKHSPVFSSLKSPSSFKLYQPLQLGSSFLFGFSIKVAASNRTPNNAACLSNTCSCNCSPLSKSYHSHDQLHSNKSHTVPSRTLLCLQNYSCSFYPAYHTLKIHTKIQRLTKCFQNTSWRLKQFSQNYSVKL